MSNVKILLIDNVHFTILCRLHNINHSEYFCRHLTQNKYVVSHLYIYIRLHIHGQLFISVSTPHRTSTANTLLGINGTDNYPYLTVIKDHARSLITIKMSHTSVFPEQFQ